MINGKKIGLVLGGGASKGFAHIGAIKVLEKNGIKPDIVVGTSMGSVIGGLYSFGMTVEEMENTAKKFEYREIVDVNVFGMLKNGVVVGRKFLNYIDKLTNKANIEDFKTKFACNACDLKTGKEFIFDSGKLSIAVRASSSVPGVFTAIKYNDMLLTDGGVINNIPTDIAKKMGADYIISVDCIGDNYLIKDMNNTLDILMTSFNIVQHEYEKAKKNFADTKIVVENSKYGFTERTHEGILDIINMGEIATENMIVKIKSDLNMK